MGVIKKFTAGLLLAVFSEENGMEYVFIVAGIFLTIVLTAKVAEAHMQNKRFEAADKVRREG